MRAREQQAQAAEEVIRPESLKKILYRLARQRGARGSFSLLGGDLPSRWDVRLLEACWHRNVSRRAKVSWFQAYLTTIEVDGERVQVTIEPRR